MSRPTGRRSARRQARSRTWRSRTIAPLDRRGVLALIGVAVTLAGFAVAGAAPADNGAAPAAEPRAAVADRVFSCTGSMADARALYGSVAGPGGLRERPVRDDVLRVRVPQDRAPSAFAAQVAEPGGSLAFGPCPEPASESWFVGAGGSVGHGSTLVVDNPRPGAAVVDIEVLGPDGKVEAPGLRGITIAGGSTRTFDLARVAPSTGELAAHVTTSRGLVSVAVTDRFTLGRIGRATREWIPDQRAASDELDLVGLPAGSDRATLLVANPGDVEAVVDLEVVGEKGPFAPKGRESLTVAPGAVGRLDVTGALDRSPASLRLRSSTPVVATVRSVTGQDQAYATAAAPLDGTSTFAVPAAGSRDLVVTALGRDATLTVVTHAGSGRVLARRQVDVTAQTTTRVRLPVRARFAELVSPGTDAVAGLVVADGPAGIGAMAIPPAVQALTLPAVHQGW
jgi:hypothetical protein